jgi:ribosomal protein S28E/S33
MTPDEIAALFYRLVVDEDVSEYHACRQCRRVYASAVMEAVVLRLLKDRGTARKLKREFMGYIGEIELADIMELSEEQRKVLVLGLTMKGLFIL